MAGKNARQVPDTQEEREATVKLRESFFCPLLNASYRELIAKAGDHSRLDAKECTLLYVQY